MLFPLFGSLLVIIPVFGLAQVPLAHIDNAVFYRPGGNPFTEVYIKIPASALSYKELKGGKYQAGAKINLKVAKNGEVQYHKRYIIKSPELSDTSVVDHVMRDQRNIPLQGEGSYTLYFAIQDVYDSTNKAFTKKVINAQFPEDQPAFSDIKLLDTAYKDGRRSKFSENHFVMLPKASNIITQGDQMFYLYAELYNIDEAIDKDKCKINLKFSANQEPYLAKSKKFEVKPVVKFLAIIDKAKLMPRENKLMVEVLGEDGKGMVSTGIRVINKVKSPKDTISLKQHFYAYSKDSLLTFIDWVTPIIDRDERQDSRNYATVTPKDTLVNFLVNFWKRRNAIDPKSEWLDYKQDVHYVNQKYSSPLYDGYESERGRVYLQYGPPNSIVRSKNDPNTYPYEIWHYFSIPRQVNVRFVFYSSSILEEEFVLLHSDARGEINNPQWKEQLNRSPFEEDDPFGNDPTYDFIK